MTGHRQPMRTRESRRAGADDRDATTGIGRAFEQGFAARHCPVSRVTLQCTDRNCFVILMISHAGAFAQNLGRTYSRAYSAERIRREDVRGRALQIAVADLANETRNVDLRGTGLDAR